MFGCEDKEQDTIPPDTTPPTVSISSHSSGQTVNEVVTITIVTQDNEGISRVEFFIDDSLMLTDSESPFEYDWNTTTYEDGTEHIIKVISYDTSDNSIPSQPIMLIVDNSGSFPQSVNILSVSYTLVEMTFQLNDINDDDFGSYDLMKGDGSGSNWNTCNYIYNETVVVQVTEPNSSLTITDFNPLEPTCYWIKVSDIYGLSTEGAKYYVMDDEPTTVTFDEIIYEGNSFSLSWTKNTDDDFFSYILYESLSEDMSDSTQIFTIDDINTNSYIIDSVDEGINKYYHIIVEDIWGLQSTSNIQLGSPWVRFSKTYSDLGISYGFQITNDDGYIIVGDDFLLKTDSQGNEVWINSGDYEYWFSGYLNGAVSIDQTIDGGYMFIYPLNSDQIRLIKLDLNGNEEWNNSLGNSNYSMGFSVKQTFDGGYIITGGNWSINNGGNVGLFKTDEYGNQEWNREYADWCGNCRNFGRSVQQTSDGGYIVAGWEGYIGNYGQLVKTDSQGNEMWSNSYGGFDVEITSDGGYIVVGEKLHKLNSEGIIQWQIELSGWNTKKSTQQTSDGGYIVSNISNIIKLDTNGNEEWTQSIEGLSYSFVKQTNDDGYIIVGQSTDGEVILIKTDPYGHNP